MKSSVILSLSLFIACGSALAEPLPELQPLLGKRGKLIGSADFETSPAEGTFKGFGEYAVTGGVLRQQQKEGQDHNPSVGFTTMLGLNAAAERAFELKEGILQFDFRTDQADHVHVEFWRKAGGIFPDQPVPEKGGISFPAGSFPPVGRGAMIFPPSFSVVFELPGQGKRYREPRLVIKDMSNFQPVQAAAPLTIDPTQWTRVLVEIRGNEVAVQLSNGQRLQATCAEASASKKTPYFYAIEKVGRSVEYDNVKLWEIE
jgi:hypothetical protein